jgi:hypothetical protein
LVELSVVVVIVAVFLTLGLAALSSQLTSASYAETKKRQALVKDALTAYLGANRRLPCPAKPNNTNGATSASQVTGIEDRVGSVPTGPCSGTIGIVPYATLRLGREAAQDGWANFMSYSLPVGGTPCPGAGVDWSLTACFGAAKTSPYYLVEGSVAAPVQVASNVLAVVVSHGPNGFGAWAQQGSRNALPGGCEEAHNAIATVGGCALTSNAFYKGERPEMDDVVAYLTTDEAINTLAKQGTIKTADGQVADDLAQLRSTWMDSWVAGCVNPSISIPKDSWGNSYTSSASVLPISLCSTRGGFQPPTCAVINTTDVQYLRAKLSLLPC